MKRKILLVFTLFTTAFAFAQYTYIPDNGLEYRLQQLGLDSGPIDNQVLTGNIDDLEDFKFGNFVVTDITGLQDFIALKELRVDGAIADLSPIENLTNLEELAINDVIDTSLDVSALTNLKFLYISETAFTSLDLSTNSDLLELSVDQTPITAVTFGNHPLLTDIWISYTSIINADFTGCSGLTNLNVSYNDELINLNVSQSPLLDAIEFNNNILLPYIDLSANSALTSVRAQDNNALETIYIRNGNNTAIGQTFRVRDNTSLTCVEVDDVAWSNTFWGFATNYFTGFSTSCTPSNDDCAQATPITLLQPASGTTLNASNSTNTPGCEASGITFLDIWYQFPAPASGSVTMTINAPPLVGKIALYASCADAGPIACQENELSVTGLTPNATYYIQVWLEADAMNRIDGNPENMNGGFILAVQDTTTLSVNDIQNNENQVLLYPNPAKDVLTVSTKTALNEITLYDISGKQVLNKNNLTSNSETISLNKLSGGMYLVTIKTEKGIQTKKLIIN